MSASITRTPVGVWVLAGAVLSLFMVGLALPAMSAAPTRYLVVVPFAVLLVVALLRMPVHVLPAFAFALYGVGMVQFVQTGLPIGTSSIILIVWVLRRAASGLGRIQRSARLPGIGERPARIALTVPLLAVALAIWLLLLTQIGDLGASSTGWLLAFLPVVVVPLLVPDLRKEAKALEATWIVLAGVMGVYAIVEFILRANFVYWALGAQSSQHWSVYRSEGPFGHPLLFGTFLAVGTLLAFGRWLEGHRSATLLTAFVALAGVLVTSSRSSLVAVIVGILLALAMVVMRPGSSRRGRAFGLALILSVGAALIALTPLLDRWTSDEADGSSAARSQGFELALSLAERSGFLGNGAGTSSLAATLTGSTLPIELSPLQALVSVGIPGLLLIAALFAVGFARAIASYRVAAVAGLAAFLAAVSGYNYFDDRRSALILCGMVLVIAIGSAAAPLGSGSAITADERQRK
jgi:O-antigen ligase